MTAPWTYSAFRDTRQRRGEPGHPRWAARVGALRVVPSPLHFLDRDRGASLLPFEAHVTSAAVLHERDREVLLRRRKLRYGQRNPHQVRGLPRIGRHPSDIFPR